MENLVELLEWFEKADKMLAEDDVAYKKFTLDKETLAKNKLIKKDLENLMFGGGPPEKEAPNSLGKL